MNLNPDDRVLLAGQFSAEQVRAFATQLTNGSVCALVPSDHVATLRRELREMQNVLVVPEDPEGSIPWADGYFSVVVAHGPTDLTPEIRRVLSEAGRFQSA